MSHAKRLHDLIVQPPLLVMPAAYDALSAKLAEEAGFQALQVSGLSLSAADGLPDFSILSMREMVERTRRIAAAVDIPVMGDGDTGYGGVVNVWHTVREFEDAGAAGVNLEDQVFPKRCGRLEGKEIIPSREMCAKLDAAVSARRDGHFVLNARTDSLGLEGIPATVARANAYLSAGATMVFIQGVSRIAEIEQLVGEIRGPVAMNLIEQHAGCSELTFERLQALGVARVSLSTSLMLSAIHGMRQALARIQDWGGTRVDPEVFASFEDLHTLSGTREAQAIEKRAQQYLAQGE
jgi:2-methylisocitrate lyase-like PEP mutase family enzyme